MHSICVNVDVCRMSECPVCLFGRFWPSIPPGNSAGSTASARGRHGESKATSSLAGHRTRMTKGFNFQLEATSSNLKQPDATWSNLKHLHCIQCTLLHLHVGKRCQRLKIVPGSACNVFMQPQHLAGKGNDLNERPGSNSIIFWGWEEATCCS